MAGLLGAATVNPLMARQFANARQNVTAPTSVMDERYPAWKKSQDQATQFLLAADLIGSAVPAGLLAAPAMKKGLLSMGETLGPPVKRGLLDFADTAAPKIENYMERNGMLTRITAYQGSPHKYDPEKLVRLANGETAYVGGKFNALKEPPPGSTVLEEFPLGRIRSEAIGTGEGAQAYGHGSYLAESPEVARSYKTALAADRGFSFGGKSGLTRAEVQDMVNAMYGPGYLDGVLRPSGVADSFIDDMVTGLNRPKGSYPKQYKVGSDRAKIYDELRGQITHTDPGSIYTVDLPDPMIAKMLDWDKPLSQQAPEVQKALHKAGLVDFEKNIGPSAAGEIRDLGWTKNVSSLGGEDLYRRLVERQFMNKGSISTSSRKLSESEVSGLLREQGIPGIRYLDGGSRGTGAGTSNFVVFPGNEQLVKILSRE